MPMKQDFVKRNLQCCIMSRAFANQNKNILADSTNVTSFSVIELRILQSKLECLSEANILIFEG